jgi:hypothetical protein
MVTAMRSKKQLLAAFGALALGAAAFSISTPAATKHCASEECACEEALKQNTVEALEDFLRKYPQSASNQESACAAMAVPPEDVEPNNQSLDDETVQPGGSQTSNEAGSGSLGTF